MATKIVTQKTVPAKKHKPKRKEQVQFFDMATAMEECRARNRRRQIAAENEQREQRRLQETAAKDLAQLRQRGALLLTPTEDREAWITRCFQLIQLLRKTPDCAAQYNSDWKEVNRFAAGLKRS